MFKKVNNNDFLDNGRTYKTCQVCRQRGRKAGEKIKNELIARKEAMVGGTTLVCNTCEIEKDVTCFNCKRTTNTLSPKCRECVKEAFEQFTMERKARVEAQKENGELLTVRVTTESGKKIIK